MVWTPSSLAARRCGLAIAVGAFLALAAAGAAAAAPQTGPGTGPGTGPDAGPEAAYTGGHGGKRKLRVAGWNGWNSQDPWAAPQRWLAYSRECFQRIMWMLADRSAGLHGPYRARPQVSRETRRDWPDPPAGYEPVPARWPEAREDDDDEERPRRRQPEARPDHDGSDWPGERRPRCHAAGQVVQGGGWYVVRHGDTLWNIAEAHYGDGRAWRRVLRANWRTVPDASCIYACQRLYIPPPLPWEDDRPPARRPWSAPDWPNPPEPGWRNRPEPGGRDQPVGQVRLLSPRGCSDCGAGSHARDPGWR